MPSYKVNIQGANLRVVGSQNAPPVAFGIRGDVSIFSRASHRRYIEWFNRLKEEAIQKSWFITLTYPDEAIPDSQQFKRDSDVFFRRLLRQFPNISILWKAELEDRKSGHFKGVLVPHLHCLLVSKPEGLTLEDFRNICAQNWFDVVGSNQEKHLRAGTSVIEAYGTIRNVVRYVAKYTSKLISHKDALAFGWKGRWWGIVGRRNLPLAEEFEFDLNDQSAIQFRRLVRHWLKSNPSGRKYAKSIASKSEMVGFNVWGIPSDQTRRMVDHAKALALEDSAEQQNLYVAKL